MVVATYKDRIWSWDFVSRETLCAHDRVIDMAPGVNQIVKRPDWFKAFVVPIGGQCG